MSTPRDLSVQADFYSVGTLAQLFDVQATTVRAWVRDNQFPNAFKIGTRWKIPRADVIAFVNKEFG